MITTLRRKGTLYEVSFSVLMKTPFKKDSFLKGQELVLLLNGGRSGRWGGRHAPLRSDLSRPHSHTSTDVLGRFLKQEPDASRARAVAPRLGTWGETPGRRGDVGRVHDLEPRRGGWDDSE